MKSKNVGSIHSCSIFFYTNSMINCNEVIKTRFFSLKWMFCLLFVDNLLFKNNPIIFFTSILENL